MISSRFSEELRLLRYSYAVNTCHLYLKISGRQFLGVDLVLLNYASCFLYRQVRLARPLEVLQQQAYSFLHPPLPFASS
jgi:hypothetical protein